MARFGVLVLLLAGGLAAQPWPADAVYAVSNFGVIGNRLMGFTAGGAAVYSVPLPPAGGSADSICMNPRNDTLIIADTDQVHRMVLTAGGFLPDVARPDGAITWLDVDEDGGIVWCTSAGRIFRAATVGGAAVLLKNDPGFAYNAIAWNGSTGGYVAARFAGDGDGRLYFLDRDGVVVRVVGGLTYLSGVDWDPFTGHVIVTRFGGAASPSLYAVPGAGVPIPYGPPDARTATAQSVEVIENPKFPFLPRHPRRFVGVEYGGAPRHIYRKSPDAVVPSAVFTHDAFGPSDLEVVRSRQVWGLHGWRQGKTAKFSVNFGPACAAERYKVVLSATGHTPGIRFGAAGTLHIVWDWLSVLSFLEAPPFHFFSGVLNLEGRAAPDPRVDIPAGTAGLRIYAGAVAYNAGGVIEISNCYGVTIEP